MYFCPKCSYSLDLQKETDAGVEKEKEVIDTPTAAFKKILKEKIAPSGVQYKFTKNDLIKNSKYVKLTDEEKNLILAPFEENQDNNISRVQFYCQNCFWSKSIKKSVMIYAMASKDEQKILTQDELELVIVDPTRPRTKDYYCKNPKCITHGSSDTKKEAVFFRNQDDNGMNYVCTVCKFNWKV